MKWPIGLALFAFWLLMMGLLLYRERGPRLFSPGKPAAENAPPLSPRETWMGLFVDDRRVGLLHVDERPEPRDGLAGTVMRLEVHAALNLLGRVTDFDLAGEVWRPAASPRADFNFDVRSADYDFRVDGRLADGLLEAEVTTAGESLPLSVPVSEDLVFTSGFGTAVEFPSLAVGEEARLASFDPLTLQKSSMRLRCLAEETLTIAGVPTPARRLEVTSGALRSQVWIDSEGGVLQIVTPFGWTLRRGGPELREAVEATSQETGEILRSSAVEPRGKRPFRGAATALYHVVSASGRELPEDGVQVALGGGRYRVTRPAAPAAATAGGGGDLDRHLASDAFVQSDHPRIRRQAAAIVGAETDPWRRALAIHQWVFERVEKEPVASIPSALEVLDRRRGDCNEHTVLFTALARAAGLPARIAIGLVWSDELAGFYYHAWPEVYVGGWVWMDPTLGQPLADATHLKLLNGGIESWMGLLPHLGQLEIEVLEIR